MFYFLIQKGITMKSLMKVTCTALLFTGIMAGCSGNATQNKKKHSSKNAMHYGKSLKRIL